MNVAAFSESGPSHDPSRHLRGNQPDYLFGTRELGWQGVRVVRWHGVEELSRPFRYEIAILRDADLGPIPLRSLVGSGASFAMWGVHRARAVHGIVESAEEVDRTRRILLYRVVLAPHLVRARHRLGCRTFRKTCLRDIISSVLENRVASSGGGLDELSELPLQFEEPDLETFVEPSASQRWVLAERDSERLSDPEYRSHVVQYNESDFDFVSRLLEEEGLSYFFEHAQGHRCVMTITDHPGAVALFDRRETWVQRGIAKSGHAHADEVVRSFRERLEMRPGVVRHRDYRRATPLLQPESAVLSEVGAAMGSAGAVEEQFAFPCPGGKLERDFCELFSRLRTELHEAERLVASGSSSVRVLEPGVRFTLRDGDGLRDDTDLVVVRLEAYGSELSPEGTELDAEPFGFSGKHVAPHYENRFRALPARHVFRPALVTPKPRIHGVHAAIVTAEEFAGGKEINTNQWGDVRVRFPWDQRQPVVGVASSRWVPVTNQSAGTGYGMVSTPRVGQAVQAAFQGGDADLPVVLGGYYSDQMPPPVNPGASPTVSTFRTNSSPGGGGANQMSFDDSAGNEMFSTTAQKDQSVKVGNNFDQTVDNDHSTDVGNDFDLDVAGDKSLTCGGDECKTIDGDKCVSVGGDLEVSATNITLGGGRTITIECKYRTDSTSAVHVIQAGQLYLEADDIELRAGGSAIRISKDGITISAGGVKIVGTTVDIIGAPVNINGT